QMAPVVDQQKRELRIGQRVVLNEIGDVKALSRIALQKLAACGEIEEEVAHFNFGASRPCDVADGDQLAAVKLYLGAFSVRGSFSSKEQTRDRCNRRQRFASKTECSDGFEIISGTKLRRRVTFESDDSIVASHPLAVVEHADQPLTARL